MTNFQILKKLTIYC